ncbi:MAG TPA: glycosyltransferase family 4 protein [Thermoanaerobaculia bacterium]|nr:glycosyltransferase family 4 protein [Thermoanaerobaculia bacterium]
MNRLLIVAQAQHALGGVPVWLGYLAPGLQRAGWQVRIGLVANRRAEVRDFLVRHPTLRDFAVGIVNATGTVTGRRQGVRRAIERWQPGLVLVIDVADAYGAVEDLRQRGRQAPLLMTALHGIHPAYFDDLARWGSRLDGLVCSNRLTLRMAVDAGMPEERVAYAPVGVDFEGPSRSPSGSDVLRIAWVGRLDPFQKRPLDLVGIAERIAAAGVRFEMVVAGGGSGHAQLAEALATAASPLPVRLVGGLSPRAVADEVYPSADVLLITSLWETGPIVAWEAMARGIPVVSSRFIGSGLEDALRHEENCLLFDIGDLDGACAGVLRSQDPAARATLVAGGRELVTRRYSTARSVESWRDALAVLCRASTPRRPTASQAAPAGAGRLDRWLGAELGERARGWMAPLQRSGAADAPWPFSYGDASLGNSFWTNAAERDGLRLPAAVQRELTAR